MVFVNHYANPATPLVFKTANHAAVAINLYITARTYNFSRKHDGEIHRGAHGYVTIYREEHAVGGNVSSLRGTTSALRHDFDRQMQRKPRRALHRGVVLAL